MAGGDGGAERTIRSLLVTAEPGGRPGGPTPRGRDAFLIGALMALRYGLGSPVRVRRNGRT